MLTILDHNDLQRTPTTLQSSTNTNQPRPNPPEGFMNIITKMQDHIEQLEAQLQTPP
jgi:hypothetical protein